MMQEKKKKLFPNNIKLKANNSNRKTKKTLQKANEYKKKYTNRN